MVVMNSPGVPSPTLVPLSHLGRGETRLCGIRGVLGAVGEQDARAAACRAEENCYQAGLAGAELTDLHLLSTRA